MPRPLTADCLTGLDGLAHGFFTREGGVSGGIYAALNCGLGSADATEAVLQNRARVAAHLGAPASEALPGGGVLTLHQVHSAEAVVVDALIPRDRLPRADALVTRTRGLVIGALAADCGPVLFADPVAGVIGAAHAGWRGAFEGVLEATVAAMEGLGARRAEIRAALGPCIGPAAYQVGPEFEAAFLARDSHAARFFSRMTPVARPHFDLPRYVQARLERLGLAAVESCAACTFSDSERFFSYRRSRASGEPDYGRQISAIVLA